MEERILNLEHVTHDNSRRLEEMQASLESIRELAMSVNGLAIEMKHMREEQNALNERLCKIEGQPAARWNAVVLALIGCAASAAVGFWLSR